MRYYIVSGEASGDLHASNMVLELKKLDRKAEIRAWGGDRLSAQGATLVKHIKDLSFMGFLEVIKNIRTISGFLRLCKKDLKEYAPDVLVLVDYPGFNLRIAPYAKTLGIKVVYYISPQVWAWKKKRVFTIEKVVDRMMAILPFEKDFYKKYNINIDFVGHPLLDEVAKFKSAGIPELLEKEDKRPIITLLPGSRKQEISKMLPEMIEAANYFPDYKFVIAGAPSQKASFYHEFMQESKIELIFGKTYDLLHSSHAALVTSGTATLETALFNVPQVVCYRTSGFSYQIGKRLINVPFISLVNLILNKEVVSELVQDECNASRMQTELKLILDGVKREEMLDAYQVLKTKLGGTGASLNAAKIVLETANS